MKLVAERLGLGQELAQAKLGLKLKRQNKVATNAQKNGDYTQVARKRRCGFTVSQQGRKRR